MEDEQRELISSGELIHQGEAITISLEDAAQLLLQQQGISSNGEVHLPPGTYQIHTQSVGGPTVTSQTGMLNQISVAQSIEQGMLVFGPESSGILFQTDGEEVDENQGSELLQESVEADTVKIDGDQGEITPENDTDQVVLQNDEHMLLETDNDESLVIGGRDFDSQSESVLQIDLPVSQPESVLQIDLPVSQSEGTIDIAEELRTGEDSKPTAQMTANGLTIFTTSQLEDRISVSSDVSQSQAVVSPHDEMNNLLPTSSTSNDDVLQTVTEDGGVQPAIIDGSVEADGTAKVINIKVDLKPDLSNPIAVTDHMEVVVNGKKCLLKMNCETGQLCAYPILPAEGKRRRGRPRKVSQQKSSLDSESEQDTSVLQDSELDQKAEIELKPIKLYGQDSDQANSAAECLLELSNTGPDGIRRSGRVRKKAKTLNDYDVLEVSSDEDQGEADEDASPSKKKKYSVNMKDYNPATSLSIVGGVKRGRGRPRRYPPQGQTTTQTQISAMLIPSSDGQSLMMAPIQGLTNLQAFQEQVRSMPALLPKPGLQTDERKVEVVTDSVSQYLNPPIPSSVNNSVTTVDHSDFSVQGILDNDTNLEANQTSETNLPDNVVTDSSLVEVSKTDEEVAVKTSVSETKITLTSSGENQPTIIQIPENLLPMFMQKKDPVKLGLKASEDELEKFKCPKCDFQAYYFQQYQKHITSHTDDIHKCKCCSFHTFSKEELLEHFKENHPRCFCSTCDFMAEHAYVIKRHMMRHNADGCKCEICGKVYKDQYVLKMHVKMVHMPAEVLFECTLCSKKFTRKAHLKRHLRIHEPEKPFKCPHCIYRGCERSDISKHLLIHEEPKHVCEVCGKAFRHIKNKELHVKRHNGQRDYKCGVCDFYGYTFTDIRKHIERKHTESKPFFCDKCRLPFKTEPQLRQHECEVVMIEQALAIATSDGGTSQATIQIPSSLSATTQHIQINGQHIALDTGGQVITVEQVNLPDEDGITLTEDQLHQAHIAMAQGQELDTGQVELITQINAVDEDVTGDSVQHEELDSVHLSEVDDGEMSEQESVGDRCEGIEMDMTG